MVGSTTCPPFALHRTTAFHNLSCVAFAIRLAFVHGFLRAKVKARAKAKAKDMGVLMVVVDVDVVLWQSGSLRN